MSNIFTYTDDIALHTVGTAHVIIPKSVSSKTDLFRLFSENLSFPECFGENWDALYDCLRDLSWLHEKRVVVAHDGIPAALSADDLRAYLGLLGDAVISWQINPGEHELIVTFPVGSSSTLQ